MNINLHRKYAGTFNSYLVEGKVLQCSIQNSHREMGFGAGIKELM
jgi:hypothetical protein